MEATVQYTDDFFDNLTRYKKVTKPETKEPEPDEYFFNYDDVVEEPPELQPQPLLDRIPYTRAHELPEIDDVCYETEATKEEINHLDKTLADIKSEQNELLKIETEKMQTFQTMTNDVLDHMKATEPKTSPDICADFRTALMDCYRGGEHCEFFLKQWKECEANRKF